MTIVIVLEGQGGELDRREVEEEEEIAAMVRDLGYTCDFRTGDSIRIFDKDQEGAR